MSWKKSVQIAKNLLILGLYSAVGLGGVYIGFTSPSPDAWWQGGTFVLVIAIIFTLAPIVWGFLVFTELFPPGEWFDSSEELKEHRVRLVAHYSRITGTLKFWKSKASAHQRLYSAQVVWATLSGVALPVLVQYFDKTTIWPTLFLTILTTWNGILLALTFTLNSRELYRGFRQQESDFYDESRRLLNAAKANDPDLANKVEGYIQLVASIRRVGRRVETGSPPSALDR